MAEAKRTSRPNSARPNSARPNSARPAWATGQYNMDHDERGIALVINIMNFDDYDVLPRRLGSDRDVESITDALTFLGFQVVIERDKTAQEIQSILDDVANWDHTNNDCFVCVVMSHGEEGGIYGSDGEIVTEKDLCKPFHHMASLEGKPKLFFIQACRGGIEMDSAAASSEHSDERLFVKQKLPKEADYLVHFATVSSYKAWKDIEEGSFFIQALSRALKEKATEESLIEVLTFVNNEISTKHLEIGPYLQVPEIRYRLRGTVIFKPKRTNELSNYEY